MHYYHHLSSLLFLLTLALPSFALFDFGKGRLLQPGSSFGSIYVEADVAERFSVPFDFITEQRPELPGGVDITVAGFQLPAKGINEFGLSVTLNITEIKCQCFKDFAGTEILGDTFTSLGNSTIPSEGTIKSILCSNGQGLQAYFKNKGIEPPL
ncbi:MAG: hypothetical protein Q9210_004269 [Variospora velana]